MLQDKTDWKRKYTALCDVLMCEFTPGGSEFYQDPMRCIRFAKEQMEVADRFRMDTILFLKKHPFISWLWKRLNK
jgi:hypothetical protein